MALVKAVKNTVKLTINTVAAGSGYAAGHINNLADQLNESEGKFAFIAPQRKVKQVYGEAETIGKEHNEYLLEKASAGVDSVLDLFADDEPKTKPVTGYGSFGKNHK